MTQIPQSFIDQAVKARACLESIEWLTFQPRTVACLFDHNPSWVVWGLRLPGWVELLTNNQFDWCRRECPGEALMYGSARLTDEQFSQCILAAPNCAIAYNLARLTDYQFDCCRNLAPGAALRYGTARLTAVQFAQYIVAYPMLVLANCMDRLTPEQFAQCQQAAAEWLNSAAAP